ncbi:hypothetical protein [Amaricoccus tamworthensis]|uniref:hypothetical protein n=1 Tax=Amaricoccus tamworthensis TaxID=57002 RepID=UPI003C7DE2A6
MCERAGIAKKISGLVPSVTQALCRGHCPDGTFIESPCASGCPHLQQKDISGPHVVFTSHAYLTVNLPVDREYRIALRVIDEKVWPTLTRTSYLSIDDFMRTPPGSIPESSCHQLLRAKDAIVDGLQRGLPLHDHLRESGISTDALLRFAAAEERSLQQLEIGPWQSVETATFRVDTFDTGPFLAARRRQQLFERLAEKESGYCPGVRLTEQETSHGSRRVIQLSGLHHLKRDAPLLLLDADAHPDITEQIAPGAVFVSLQSPPRADIVQVSDLTLSNSWLLHPEDGAKRRAGILGVIRREVLRAAGGGVLVVATRAVLKALHEDVGNPIAGSGDEGLKQPLMGADARWFGPRTQGVNDFEGFAAIVIVGRLQPRIGDIETAARAVFSRDELPITAHVSGSLPSTDAQMLMQDGSFQKALLRAHPDPRAQAILAQSRECATLQAIARLRLVAPDRTKRVVIMSSLPLPDFPITRLSTLAALEKNLEHEPDWRGAVRIEKALQAFDGRPVRGTRLSATGLNMDLPLHFETEDSARRFRRGRTTSHLVGLCRRAAAAKGWPITALLLRRENGGKAVPAIVLEDHAPLDLAAVLWPDLTPQLA